jgi:non-canonical purine NTP pyrophosphatase (RdgB/HAM1 family)
MSICFITGNINKLKEFVNIFGKSSIIITHKSLQLPEVQSVDVAEVVEVKALHAFQEVKQPVIVEDTGLYIGDTMNGFPGALIKHYYEKLGSSGICKINGGTNAYAETIICYCGHNVVRTFVGRTYGKIAYSPQKGNYGFGWDDIFIPDSIETFDNSMGLSFAEILPEQKNMISMRRQAIDKFRNEYESTEKID